MEKAYHNILYKLGFERRKKLQNLFYNNESEIFMLNKPFKTCKIKKECKHITIVFSYDSFQKSERFTMPDTLDLFKSICYATMFRLIDEANNNFRYD
tara:strand:+ start:565 stop:855 length:291 start_codon:yes stop_codon:yes gene_type:complete